jgi:ABC-type transport system involved in multi-copper enzyme maturation permease subunit
MNSPAALRIVRWLVYDTFRQALASRLFWAVSGLTVLCVVFCLGVRVSGPGPLPLGPGEPRMRVPAELAEGGRARQEGVDVARSELSLLFGAVRIEYRHYGDDAVRFVQLLLAGFVADTAGVLLALLWTAGFLPGFLEPGAVTVCLARPAPRWSLLAGKYLGVVGFVALQAGAFVLGTWLALGVATGVWAPFYLVCLPVLLAHFAVFFSVSAALAVWRCNAVVCAAGALAFWALCWATNHAWHSAAALGGGAWWLQVGYWVLPKPADLNWVLYDGLQAPKYFGTFLDYPALAPANWPHLELSIATSLAFAAAVLAAAGRRFVKADY